MTAQRARFFLWVGTTALVCVIIYLSFTALIPFLVGAFIAYAAANVGFILASRGF